LGLKSSEIKIGSCKLANDVVFSFKKIMKNPARLLTIFRNPTTSRNSRSPILNVARLSAKGCIVGGVGSHFTERQTLSEMA
jgi:hypothetical protein